MIIVFGVGARLVWHCVLAWYVIWAASLSFSAFQAGNYIFAALSLVSAVCVGWYAWRNPFIVFSERT